MLAVRERHAGGMPFLFFNAKNQRRALEIIFAARM